MGRLRPSKVKEFIQCLLAGLWQSVSRVCWRPSDTSPQLSCQEELRCYATNPLFRKRRPEVPKGTNIQPI